MNQARSNLGVAVVNGKIYAIGGSNRYSGGVVGTNEEYDPTTNTWSYKAPMPTPRTCFGIAVYQNKIYCIGGETNDSGAVNINEVYEPATDSWTAKASMPTARYYLTANTVNDKIYLISGLILPYLHSPIPLTNVNEAYNPLTDSWENKTSIPMAVYGYASAAIDDKVYVIGGQGNNRAISNQIYDTKNNIWSLGANLLTETYYASAGAIATLSSERVYVLGGASIRYTNQVYDLQNNSWSTGASLPTDRISLGVATLNNTLYAIGGKVNSGVLFYINPSTINEQYIPTDYQTPSLTLFSNPTATPSSTITPTESPSITSNPSPTESPSKQPTTEPTITASPTLTPPINIQANSYAPMIIILSVVVLAMFAGLLVYFKKRHRKGT